MRNPFRSEAEAYRFLLLTVGAFTLIVAGAFVNRWLGVAVWLVVSAAAVQFYFRQRGEPPPRAHVEHVGPEDERRILVIANETLGGDALQALIRERSANVREQVLVVCPALNSPVRHWASDEDAARADAQARLDACLAALAAAGVQASGEVGDADPLQAIEDALRTFGADEIVISTHPEGESSWLERSIVDHACERFDVAVTHVIVEPAGKS